MKAFFIARGGIEVVPGTMWMPGRCPQLTDEGLCGCYEERPMVCALFTPGCSECMTAVKKFRTPEQYARIRDDDDPETIHDQT
jgi:Fe-S-cluster containining protein